MTPPILKWAGGKRWLASSDRLPIPKVFTRYVEPFVGGAAVFFHIAPPCAILADVNPDLINLYQVVRDRPADFQLEMERHQAKHTTEYYYQVREALSDDPMQKAARFLYLNRTCWNGLYRVNRLGQFNVPIGTKQAVVMPTDDFEATSRLLQSAELYCSDFERIIDMCQEGDYLFVDPPYTVKHNFNGFIKYNEHMFSWEDQVRLSNSLVRAASRGVAICVTNADHPSVRELYNNFDLKILSRHSVLAGKSGARGATTEAMFTVNM